MGGGEYTTDPAALDRAATGIDAVIGELNGLGIASSGEAGRGFSQVAPSPLAVGHAGLHEAVESFASRWSWGVRTLVQDGQEYAVRLGLSAGKYEHMEQYTSGSFKELVGSLGGDPRATGEQLESQSWGDLVTPDMPDYSPDSFAREGEHSAQVWSGVGRDLSDGSWAQQQLEQALGVHDRLETERDTMFGPAPGGD